ncbi:MAG: DUF4214 domain-containing protein [Elusimicrobia bacterium]|nr:DUF4214 domain-containing protein [Elusimicrobiota bacterium]
MKTKIGSAVAAGFLAVVGLQASAPSAHAQLPCSAGITLPLPPTEKAVYDEYKAIFGRDPWCNPEGAEFSTIVFNLKNKKWTLTQARRRIAELYVDLRIAFYFEIGPKPDARPLVDLLVNGGKPDSVHQVIAGAWIDALSQELFYRPDPQIRSKMLSSLLQEPAWGGNAKKAVHLAFAEDFAAPLQRTAMEDILVQSLGARLLSYQDAYVRGVIDVSGREKIVQEWVVRVYSQSLLLPIDSGSSKAKAREILDEADRTSDLKRVVSAMTQGITVVDEQSRKWGVTGRPELVELKKAAFTVVAGDAAELRREWIGIEIAKLASERMSSDEKVVFWLYKGFMDRPADAGGFAYWTGRVRARLCKDGGAGVTEEAVKLADAFFFSPEYAARQRTNRQYVGDLYGAFLQRSPEPGGWNYWTRELETGRKDANELRTREFVGSAEFQGLLGRVVSEGCRS